MEKKGKRICIYGGPGAGKTTLAPKIFHDLKVRGHNVILVDEWIKTWAIQGRFPRSHEQLYVFANQQHREDEVLEHVEGIVSDSPLMLNAAYALKYGYKGAKYIIALATLFEEDYPGLHIWLHRKHEYQQEGRYQNLDEAIEIDTIIQRLMRDNLPPERTYFCDQPYENTLTLIQDYLRS